MCDTQRSINIFETPDRRSSSSSSATMFIHLLLLLRGFCWNAIQSVIKQLADYDDDYDYHFTPLGPVIGFVLFFLFSSGTNVCLFVCIGPRSDSLSLFVRNWKKHWKKNYHQKLLMITTMMIIRKELCSKAAKKKKKKISNTIPAVTLRNTTTSTADIFLLSLFPFTFFNRGQSGDKNQLLLLSAPTTTATISKTRMKNIWITTTIAKPNHSSIYNCWFNIDEISEKSLRFLFLWFFGLFLLLHNW